MKTAHFLQSIFTEKFDITVRRGIILYVAVAALTFAANYLDVGVSGRASSSDREPSEVDTFFLLLYLGFALLCLQNLVLFISTREPAFRAYSYYIAVLLVQIIFFEELYMFTDIELPDPWRQNMSPSSGVMLLVMIFQFARLLLDTPTTDKILDNTLKIGILIELVAAIGLQLGISLFFVVDFLTMAIIGLVLLINTSPFYPQANKLAYIFCISFLFNYAAFYLSFAILIWPDPVLSYIPLYNENDRMAYRAVWLGGFTIEALLMSLAAYLYFRNLKSHSIGLTDHVGKLEVAIEKAKKRLLEMESSIGRGRKRGARREVAPGLREIVETNAPELFLDVTFLTKTMAVSKATLTRRLKDETGMSPAAFIRQVRLELAKRLMENGEVTTVREAANATGFINHGHFSSHFRKAFDVLPAEFIAARKAG